MNNSAAYRHTWWLIAICGLLVIYYIDSMWSWSIDLAHHYALVFRLSEQWALTTSSDPTLGEMNIYPRVSHIMAAMVGVLVGSPFLGVQVTTLVSVALIWLGIVLILNSLQARLAVVSILSFVAIVGLNAASLKLNIHGGEIVANFFYSQLVGHAVLFVAMSIAIHLEKRKGVVAALLFVTILTLLNTGVHLLPALEMLGSLYGLLFAYVFLESDTAHAFRVKLLVAVGIALVAIAGIVWHPSFAAMRLIAENNGGLDLRNVSYPYGLIVICGLVIVTSALLLLAWLRGAGRSDNVALKYLAFYGGATAALCLLQLGLTKFGHGSDYAVKKYAFGLTTILFLNLAIISGLGISHFLNARTSQFLERAGALNGCILAASLCVLFVLSVPTRKIVDVSEIVALERKLVRLSEIVIPAPEAGRSNVIIALGQFPSTINYMFSIAIAKTTREIAIADVLVKNDLSDLAKYSHIVSSSDHPRFGAVGCDTLSPGSISVVSFQCLEKRLARTGLR